MVAELLNELDPKFAQNIPLTDDVEQMRAVLVKALVQPRCGKTLLTFPTERPDPRAMRAAIRNGIAGGLAYVGQPLYLAGVGVNGGRALDVLADRASLDRIDNDLPHTLENCRWVCLWHNFARGRKDAEDFDKYMVPLHGLRKRLLEILMY